MNYYILSQELENDPLTRNYSAMSEQEAADDLNTEYRNRNLESMRPTEVYNNIDQTEWSALEASEQQEIWDILHLGDPLNPFGREANRFLAIFGGGSNTITALQEARVEDISRADELGLGFILASDVEKARAL